MDDHRQNSNAKGKTVISDTQGRTSLTGKPITYEHDNFAGIMQEGFPFAGTANHLPYGYTDQSRVIIPIKLSDVGGGDITSDTTAEVKSDKKKSRLFDKLSGKKQSNSDFKMVIMSRGDYLKYWAKGEDGRFLDTVIEPPEGRQEWFRRQVELSDEIRQEDHEKGKKHDIKKYSGVSGFGNLLAEGVRWS